MPTAEFFGKTYTVEGVILIKTIAVHAGRINRNFDMFEPDELEAAAHTYDNCNLVFVDHEYGATDEDLSAFEDGIDRSRTRGFIVAEHYDSETQDLHCLMAIDKNYKNLVDAIMSGKLGAVSMGCTCDLYCSICNTLFDEDHDCECGSCPRYIGTISNDGQLVYDILRNVEFYELSCLAIEQAEPRALFYEVIA